VATIISFWNAFEYPIGMLSNDIIYLSLNSYEYRYMFGELVNNTTNLGVHITYVISY
jgi:hypothetical protein